MNRNQLLTAFVILLLIAILISFVPDIAITAFSTTLRH
jgi:hypothetical protein